MPRGDPVFIEATGRFREGVTNSAMPFFICKKTGVTQ
jgi:hypothetical protein